MPGITTIRGFNLPLLNFYFNCFRFFRLSFLYGERKKAVFERCLYTVLINVIGQCEATFETPVITLNTVVFLVFRLFFMLALTFDAEHTIVYGYFDILLGQAWQLCLNSESLVRSEEHTSELQSRPHLV